MINSAIDSSIRNGGFFFFFTKIQSKQGRKIYFILTQDPNCAQEQKKLQTWAPEMQLREYLRNME